MDRSRSSRGTGLGIVAVLLCWLCAQSLGAGAVESIGTRTYTVMKVRAARSGKASLIVASTYSGTVLAIGYDGKVRWRHELSGYMNHDLWCADIDADGRDEVLAANADGSLYCLSPHGKLLWTFKPNSAPMRSACVVRDRAAPYVVCGGYDKNIYYLSRAGKLVKTVTSSSYSVERTWGKGPARVPPKGIHSINFLRCARGPDGKDVLVVHGVVNSNSGAGSLYLFAPLSDKPSKIIKPRWRGPYGEMRVRDVDGDGTDEILLGTSGMIDAAAFVVVRPWAGKQDVFSLADQPRAVRAQLDRFGYRVLQPEVVQAGKSAKEMLVFGSRIIFPNPSGDRTWRPDVLACKYSFNDVWFDRNAGKLLLASAQSGGSCLHIVDTSHTAWQKAYEQLSPPGKIAAILDNTAKIRTEVKSFRRPAWEKPSPPVYLMSESVPESLAGRVAQIQRTCNSPVFLKSVFMRNVENWDRSRMANKKYRDRRDKRKRYTKTGEEIVRMLMAKLADAPGISYWGGHGNDPYMLSLATQKKVIDAAGSKPVVTIYPELEDSSDDFGYVLQDLLFPLAEYCRGKNAKVFIRGKHLFWQTSVYRPMWGRFLKGDFADAIVPSMEETTDKSMELSLSARMGLWACGVVNDWGMRCARDNVSFDRLRQYSHQMVPNHFLRQQVFSMASGCRYANNFPVDQEYMSVLWDLIAKGAIYVPRRDQIVSFSPVVLGMAEPNTRFADEANNVKWTVFYDDQWERENPRVFSRLNGSWPGAPVTPWDFSRYAAGVTDRRLNFLPPYPHGLVLIVPAGAETAEALRKNLHPIYRDILKQHGTDGRDYFGQSGRPRQAADTYYRTVERDIVEGARKLPMTVTGNVAWVAAASAPGHIRLTLVDSGYINPGSKAAEVRFHTVEPVTIRDVLSKERIVVGTSGVTRITVPCGLFRFLDIEIKKPL